MKRVMLAVAIGMAFTTAGFADPAMNELWVLAPQVKTDKVTCGGKTLQTMLTVFGIKDAEQLTDGIEFDSKLGINGPGTGSVTSVTVESWPLSNGRLKIMLEVDSRPFYTKPDGSREIQEAARMDVTFMAAPSTGGQWFVNPKKVKVECPVG
ncbi:MAG: hypothetical protein PHP45_03105 [Elusimicrobiales bacterium]|nr:hypothetical protein [Elusimicrobiales bacterium]